MPEISFDFKNYIEQRRGADDALARSGAAYAYPGDLKVLRTLGRVTPVTLAVEATVRLWKNVARKRHPRQRGQGDRQAVPRPAPADRSAAPTRLHIAAPTLYIDPEVGHLNAHTFGTNEDSYIVLNGVLVDHLEHRGAALRHRPRVRAHPEQPRGLHDRALLPDCTRPTSLRALDRHAGGDGAAVLDPPRRDHLRPRGADLLRRPGGGPVGADQAGPGQPQAGRAGRHRGVPQAARREPAGRRAG